MLSSIDSAATAGSSSESTEIAQGQAMPRTCGSNKHNEKEAAWYFLQWATSAEIETRLVKSGVAPPRASVFNGGEFKAWTAELPIRQSWANSLIEISKTGTAVSYPPTERVIEAREMIGSAVQKAFLGQASAKDALCAIDPELMKLQ